MRFSWKWASAGGAACAVAAAALIPALGLTAADHLDPPSRTDPGVDPVPDIPADIADLYAWHTADKVNIALAFGGPSATTLPATFDPDVLYTINISNAEPATSPETVISFRFGRGANQGEYGVQVTGIPGTTGPVVGSVENTINANGVLIRAGLFDDPFFFDLQGFRETRSMGTLRFDNQRNFFTGKNITALVLSIPRDRLENGTNRLDIWSTASRFGGQL